MKDLVLTLAWPLCQLMLVIGELVPEYLETSLTYLRQRSLSWTSRSSNVIWASSLIFPLNLFFFLDFRRHRLEKAHLRLSLQSCTLACGSLALLISWFVCQPPKWTHLICWLLHELNEDLLVPCTNARWWNNASGVGVGSRDSCFTS